MEKGKIVRSRVDEVRHTGRSSQGVKFATPDKGDSIVAVARNAESAIAVAEVEDGETRLRATRRPARERPLRFPAPMAYRRTRRRVTRRARRTTDNGGDE